MTVELMKYGRIEAGSCHLANEVTVYSMPERVKMKHINWADDVTHRYGEYQFVPGDAYVRTKQAKRIEIDAAQKEVRIWL